MPCFLIVSNFRWSVHGAQFCLGAKLRALGEIFAVLFNYL